MNNGKVTINGKSYSGSNVQIRDGVVIVDGKNQEGILQGPITVFVEGDAHNIETQSGDITARDVGSIQTTSGDVSCGNVNGNIQTTSGDVSCGDVGGSIKTMSGDINRGRGL